VDVPLNEAAALKVGQQVERLSDLRPETIFEGKVTSITGEADLQRNTLQAKIEITNPDPRLRPEMLVRAKFFGVSDSTADNSPSSSGRLSIFMPEAAIVSSNHAWVVSPDSRADYRAIELGNEVRDGHRLVISGIKSGEHVILPPHDSLEHGARVSPSN
ncbi:MAG: efflux RND transporter periplasmic adaptor subunit, partial [Akkermansiaceae bacterium]